jgi:hypothetical protein
VVEEEESMFAICIGQFRTPASKKGA